MRRLAVGFFLLVLLSCSKDAVVDGPHAAALPPVAVAPTDALWALAPAGTTTGVVIGDGGLAALIGGVDTVRQSLPTINGGMDLVDLIGKTLARLPIDLFDAGQRARVGLDLGLGVAYFEGPTGKMMVMPVGDRAAFVAAVRGTAGAAGAPDTVPFGVCNEIARRYLCAETPAGLAAAGGSDALAREVAAWPAEQRGAVEATIAADYFPKEDDNPFLAGIDGVRVALQLERGAITLRLRVLGTPSPLVAMVTGPGVLRGKIGAAPPGFVRFASRGVLNLIAGLDRLPKGVDPKAYADGFTGEAIAYTLPGEPMRGFLRIGLRDPAPLRQLLAGCDAFRFPNVTARVAGRGCELTALLPIVPGADPKSVTLALWLVTLALWIEDDQAVLALGPVSAGPVAVPAVAHSAAASSLYRDDWGLALVGTGLFLPTAAEVPALAAAPRAMPLAVFSWIRAYLGELAIGVASRADGLDLLLRARTLWSNPDEVVAAVTPLIGRVSQGDVSAVAEVTALAARFPGTPFAVDVKTGYAGAVIPTIVGGAMAATAIPAFMRYMSQSKVVEAKIFLRKLADGAREAYLADAAAPRFPLAASPITPPLGSCCAGDQGRCAPVQSAWDSSPWTDLHFSLSDPHYFSYQYLPGPDGQDFIARAYGDLDCDGIYSTWEVHGHAADSFPVVDYPAALGDELE